MKESYDIGVKQRIFKPGDKVYIKVKNIHAQYASKLQSPWSTAHEVVSCKGVVVKIGRASCRERV